MEDVPEDVGVVEVSLVADAESAVRESEAGKETPGKVFWSAVEVGSVTLEAVESCASPEARTEAWVAAHGARVSEAEQRFARGYSPCAVRTANAKTAKNERISEKAKGVVRTDSCKGQERSPRGGTSRGHGSDARSRGARRE